MRPRFVKSFAQKIRGRRECRVLAAPAVSCAKVCKGTHTSIQVQTEHSGIPCAMALRLMPRSPWRRIRLASITAGLMAQSIRSDQMRHRQLGTSHGCRDHTVLPYVSAPFVLRAGFRSQDKPALRLHLRAGALASTASHPAFVTTRDPPLLSRRDSANQ